MDQHNPSAVVEVEKSTWNRAAHSYDGDVARLTGHAVQLLLELADLTPGSRALEVGCGPGHICEMMARGGASVTGVDLAPEMIRVAAERLPDIEFKEANAEKLPFDDGTFDAVIVNFTIHHFAQPEIACAEIRRVLKPGGRLLFAGPIEQFGFGAFIGGLMKHHTMDVLPHGPIYLEATQADYEQLVETAGFDRHQVKVHQLPLHLEGLDALLRIGWEMCKLSGLPVEQQDRIRVAVVEAASPYANDRGYEFPDRIVVGVATK